MKIRHVAIVLAITTSLAMARPATASHETTATAIPTPETRGIYAVAKVVEVKPVVRIVRVSEPQKRCWDEDYVVRAAPVEHGGTAGSAILGGIIGGAIGNAFGNGRGRDAATVTGVLIGSAIGHDRALRQNTAAYGADSDQVRTRTRCDVADTWHEEERVEGYDVTYEYQGDRFRTRMSHDPGSELKVWVSVRPVGE